MLRDTKDDTLCLGGRWDGGKLTPQAGSWATTAAAKAPTARIAEDFILTIDVCVCV
jgi:hypothetical protein